MASVKQIEANRRNAGRSTGPRTSEGKTASRYNALNTGIYADREAVLPVEDANALVALAAEYYDRYEPRTPEHRCLVDSLVSDDWLLRRFRRIEGEMMTRSCKDVDGRPSERFALADAFDENAPSLERLQRRINATRRSFERTYLLLEKRKADREAALQAQRDEVSRLRAAAEPEIGFVPSADPNSAGSPFPPVALVGQALPPAADQLHSPQRVLREPLLQCPR
jgi:hypothetical protein